MPNQIKETKTWRPFQPNREDGSSQPKNLLQLLVKVWEWFTQFSNCINFWHRFFCFFVRGQKIVWIFDPKFPTWTKHANLLSQPSSDTSYKLPHHSGFLTITIHFLLFTFQIVLLAHKKEKGMHKNWRIQSKWKTTPIFAKISYVFTKDDMSQECRSICSECLDHWRYNIKSTSSMTKSLYFNASDY